jgi:hypothetical protein
VSSTRRPSAAAAARYADDVIGRRETLQLLFAGALTNRDFADALVVLIDASLRRFAAGTGVAWTELGAEFHGVKLNKAIWALANHVRYVGVWREDPESTNSRQRANFRVFEALGIDPLHDHAARLYFVSLELGSYAQLEEALLSTACSV